VAGIKLLEEFGNVDASYDLTPEQLCEKVATADALIIRSATQVLPQALNAGQASNLPAPYHSVSSLFNWLLFAATSRLHVNDPFLSCPFLFRRALNPFLRMCKNIQGGL